MRGWAFYDLQCRSCGVKGLVGVWLETRKGEQVWKSEWDGFRGVVDSEKGPYPEAVRCAGCLSAEVSMIARDEAAMMERRNQRLEAQAGLLAF